jgi:hypothetical protein
MMLSVFLLVNVWLHVGLIAASVVVAVVRYRWLLDEETHLIAIRADDVEEEEKRGPTVAQWRNAT